MVPSFKASESFQNCNRHEQDWTISSRKIQSDLINIWRDIKLLLFFNIIMRHNISASITNTSIVTENKNTFLYRPQKQHHSGCTSELGRTRGSGVARSTQTEQPHRMTCSGRWMQLALLVGACSSPEVSRSSPSVLQEDRTSSHAQGSASTNATSVGGVLGIQRLDPEHGK
jgi:hypothetical protein